MRYKERTKIILCAEDDPDDRLLIAEAFKETGLPNTIRFVEDGEELLADLRGSGDHPKLTRASFPGLILLDLNMPRKDGREVLREIKSNSDLRPIPVVVLTTSVAEDDVKLAYGLGANSFIIKPGRFASLVQVIRALANYWFEVVQLPGANRMDHNGEQENTDPSRG